MTVRRIVLGCGILGAAAAGALLILRGRGDHGPPAGAAATAEQLLTPPVPDPETAVAVGEKRRHDRALQQVVDGLLRDHAHESSTTLVPELRARLQAAGLDLPPTGWLDAVAKEVANGHVYLVSAESLKGDPAEAVALRQAMQQGGS